MTLSLSERLRKAADTRFQLAVYDDAGRHTVKSIAHDAANFIDAASTFTFNVIKASMDCGLCPYKDDCRTEECFIKAEARKLLKKAGAR